MAQFGLVRLRKLPRRRFSVQRQTIDGVEREYEVRVLGVPDEHADPVELMIEDHRLIRSR